MTPYEIEILLHYCVSSAEFERAGAPLFYETVNKMVDDGLLIYVAVQCVHQATEKGRAHLEQMCNLPYPQQVWIDYAGSPIAK